MGVRTCLSVSSRCWEVQECEMHKNSVQGHLKGCLGLWKEELDVLLRYWTQLRMVKYLLPFYNEPAPYSCLNQNSVLVESDFVNGAMADLLA